MLDLFKPIPISDELIKWFKKNGITLRKSAIPTFDNASGKVGILELKAHKFYRKYSKA